MYIIHTKVLAVADSLENEVSPKVEIVNRLFDFGKLTLKV